MASLSGVNLSSGLSDGECLNAIALGTLNLDRAFYSSGEDEADCFINDPGGGGEFPHPETATLDDLSKFCVKFGHLILRKSLNLLPSDVRF